MRFGICCNVVSAVVAERAGADFFEPSVVNTLWPTKDSISDAMRELSHVAIKPEAFNLFFPAEIKLVGPSLNWNALEAYAMRAVQRAASVGGRVIVLGSGGARRVPEDFTCEEGIEQLKRFLRMVAPHAAHEGVTIALEALSKGECNLLNTVTEAKALAAEIDHRNISVVADAYHMIRENESFDVLRDAATTIAHVHVAEPEDRGHPRPGGYDWGPFMHALKQSGYDRCISVESMWTDFSAEAPDAVRVIREAWERA